MECLELGAIRNEELLAYLAGEKVRPQVEQHLIRCQYCAAQLAEYRQLERTLTSTLYRWDCPPTQVLGEYQLGLLNNGLAVAVRKHLNVCVLCAEEVATLTEFLENDPVLAEPIPARSGNHRSAQGAKGMLEQLREQSAAGIRRIAATLIPQQPRLAYQRGETSQTALWPRRYTAEDLNISVQVERETSSRDSLQLIGFVTRRGEVLASLEGVPVELSARTQVQAQALYTQTIDELGNFVFPAIVPATYTLEMRFPERVVVIEQLPIALQD